MKQFDRPRRENAFTLIELLVVISIILVLMGLAFPVFQSVQNAAKKTQAKNDLAQIVTAVNAFYTEYGKYPIDTATATPNASEPDYVAANNTLFDVLRNVSGANTTALNPRGIAFLNVATVKSTTDPRNGVIPDGSTGAGIWYDSWGSPYFVRLDGDYDNQVTNPYTTDKPGGSPLRSAVIALSYGKNGKLGGGSALNAKFSSESGSATSFAGSADVISWQ